MITRPLIGVLLTALVWAGTVGAMWVHEEYLATHGREILLPTLPVDPRDLFRGDYVVLRYEISRHKAPFYKKLNLENGQPVYVSLKLDGQNWAIDEIALKKPERGLFLQGRISEVQKEKHQETYGIQYGIESYFVPEGEGKKLESLREQKKLSAAINVAPDGQAKIKRLVVK
ncbi:MAG: GDYXXLXY domain-containing protein [Candidatus Omnitrophota bacterium]